MSTLVTTRMPQVFFCKVAFQELDPIIYWCIYYNMGLLLPAAGLCTSPCWTAQGCSWLMAPACQSPSEWEHNPLVSQPRLDTAYVSPSLMLYSLLTSSQLLHLWWQLFHSSTPPAWKEAISLCLRIGSSSEHFQQPDCCSPNWPSQSEALSGLKSLLWETGTPKPGECTLWHTATTSEDLGYSELRWKSILCTIPKKLLHLLAVSGHP